MAHGHKNNTNQCRYQAECLQGIRPHNRFNAAFVRVNPNQSNRTRRYRPERNPHSTKNIRI